MLTHSFLYVSKCPIRLLGRAILHTLRATVHLMGDRLETGVPLDKGHQIMFNGWGQTSADRMSQPPWSQKWIEQAKGASPTLVHLKSNIHGPKGTVPSPSEHLAGLASVIQGLTDHGLIRPLQPACDTPILSVKKKPSGEYWMIQDLRQSVKLLRIYIQ